MAKILVIEDEKELNKVLQAYLTRSGYQALGALNGDEGLSLWERENPDLVLLDLNLPGMDGLEVARNIRKKKDTPIIMVTARVDEVDRLIGLELGADDYITKPFSPREVVARIKAVLRRAAKQQVEPQEIRVGELYIDLGGHRVEIGGELVTLTPMEFSILVTLAGQPGRVFTRLQLLEASQDNAYIGYERSIDAHIKNLRSKLREKPKDARYIETIFGVGYRFVKIED
ncbi:MAG: response regulator transcription factor [Chloroflexota bacterium]